jgi:cytidine deaminase
MRREEKIVFEVFDQEENIPGKLKDLFKEALKAAETAYAPYSQFKVGCSVLLESGEIILGNNQENGAYPSGLCAERVALFSALSTYPQKVLRPIPLPVAPAGR